MTNHFHVLVYLPNPTELSREEIRRRFGLLRPDERAIFYDGFILDRAPKELSRRMLHIGMFMKIVKENFTVSYNERTGHHGTMWEGPYRFKKVPMRVEDLSKVASYQNLNPILACMVCDYTSYAWTSFAAASHGDAVALSGFDFVFGGFANRTNLSDTLVRPPEEVVGMMRGKMDVDLKECQRERAEAVWRKRISGSQEKVEDPLTTEAMVAQVEEQMARVQADDFRQELSKLLGREVNEGELRFVRAMAADPVAKTSDVAKVTGLSESRIKRISINLQRLGILVREGTKRRSIWRLSCLTQQ